MNGQPFKIGAVVRDKHQSILRSKRELFCIARTEHVLIPRRPDIVPVSLENLGNSDWNILIQIKPGKETRGIHDFPSSDDALPS